MSGLFDKVMIFLGVDTSEAEAKIDAVMKKADDATEKARIQRLEIIQGVRESLTLITTSYATFTQFMRVIGAQIDPFYSALISLALSTASMMLSISAGMAATVVGIPASIIIGSLAVIINTALIAKLLYEKGVAIEAFNLAKWSVGAAQQSGMGTHGGGF